ncbi:hypothetical protein LCGC14_1398530, partial [marine sediment metagenome]
MKVEDPDMKAPVEGDRDLSLNRKVHGSFHGMAWRVVAKKGPAKKDPLIKIEKGIQKSYSRLKKFIKKFDSSLRDISPAIADDFSQYAQNNYIEPMEEGWSNEQSLENDTREVSQLIDQLSKRKKTLSQSLRRADRDTIVKTVMEAWPSGKRGWSDRAAMVAALDKAIDEIPIPEAFKAPFLRGEVSDALQDRKLIRDLIESTSKRLPIVEIEDRVVIGFAQTQQLGRLLRDGRTAVARKRAAPLTEVDAYRRCDATRADAEVSVEAPVFGSDDRVLEVLGDRFRCDHAAKLIPAPGKDIAFAVQHGDRAARAAIKQRFERR